MLKQNDLISFEYKTLIARICLVLVSMVAMYIDRKASMLQIFGVRFCQMKDF